LLVQQYGLEMPMLCRFFVITELTFHPKEDRFLLPCIRQWLAIGLLAFFNPVTTILSTTSLATAECALFPIQAILM